MGLPILITVRSEAITVAARLVALIVACVPLGLNLGVITVEQGAAILGFINSPKTAAVASSIGTLVLACLPSVMGWRSQDRELPPGVTIEDVELRGNAK